MIGIEKPGVKSAQEPVDEKQEKDLANTENISGALDCRWTRFPGLAPWAIVFRPSGTVRSLNTYRLVRADR